MSRSALTGAPIAIPSVPLQSVQAFAPEVSQSSAVTVTAHVTPHTVGAWTELIAANGADTQWIGVNIMGMSASGTDTSALIDIGVGGVGSEVAVVSSIPAGYSSSPGMFHLLPLHIAKGARISVRLQAAISADTAPVLLSTHGSSPCVYRSPEYLVTFGSNTSASRGTNMPTTDTYVEVVAATTEPLAGIVICGTLGGSIGVAAEGSVYTVAIGSVGNEVVIGTAAFSSGSAETFSRMAVGAVTPGQAMLGVVGRHIPAGTRLSCKQSIGRTYRDVVIMGVPYA